MNAPTDETREKPGSAAALLGFLCILLLGAAFRLYDLDRRLMHGDEANQAIKTAILVESGEYAYDPDEHHGPTLYYFSLVLETFLGHATRAEISETSLRLVPALFGTATIALVWLLRPALGVPATLFAALLLALSPALTFYSRYYIQEMLLAFFTLAAVIALWRYAESRRLAWGLAAGAAVALMIATKETWILAVAALLPAFALARPWSSTRPGATPNYAVHAVAVGLLAAAIWAAFFSSFGSHWRGLSDSVATYAAYFDRGRAPGLHEHPWHFYLSRLAWHHRGPGPHWTEAFILIAAATGAVSALVRKRRIAIFFAVISILLLAAFSLIPYKTPWNLVQFHAPLCVLGGIGLGAVWTASKRNAVRAAIIAVVAAAGAHLAWLNHAANFEYAQYPYNPYVYGHTSSAFQRLIDRIDSVAAEHPDGDRMLIAIIQPDGDYWPLPWYLRHFERVGYWTSIPDPLPNAVVFVVDGRTGEAVHERLAREYRFEMHALRPRILRTLYVREQSDE